MNSGRKSFEMYAARYVTTVTLHIPATQPREAAGGPYFSEGLQCGALFNLGRRNESMGLDVGRSGFNLDSRSANEELGISKHGRERFLGEFGHLA
jgi:hypothetical protein